MKLILPENRFFSPNQSQKNLAIQYYNLIKDLPIISPHGHVNPALFADPRAKFGSPTELLITPDHYIYRMLYSQGIDLQKLGITSSDAISSTSDPREIWQLFADHYYLFHGTPTSIWFNHELSTVFGVYEKLCSDTAQDIFTQIENKLVLEEFLPRNLFDQFNIEVLCTTDAAWDRLEYHQSIRNSQWNRDIRPTFRPDGVVNLTVNGWYDNIIKLSEVTKVDIHSYNQFIEALEIQRKHFKEFGATATDHAVLIPFTQRISISEAENIFQRALFNNLESRDAYRFSAHMLMEMARMSIEDGLVMQIHPGSFRNHNQIIYNRNGPDRGADIPIQTEYTRNLYELLNEYGNDPKFNLILFTLDEATYGRELAPLAGHYPALKIGPPWWFFDSINGMRRYFDQVIETAGLYNTVGFNDDTRAFPSIPARHDLWRRVSANWVAGLTIRGVIDEDDGEQMIVNLAYNLAKQSYNLEKSI